MEQPFKSKYMKHSNFIKALEIISESHSTELVINYVKPNGQVNIDELKTNPKLSIKNCCANVLHKLRDANFTLSVHNGAVEVDDYAI